MAPLLRGVMQCVDIIGIRVRPLALDIGGCIAIKCGAQYYSLKGPEKLSYKYMAAYRIASQHE